MTIADVEFASPFFLLYHYRTSTEGRLIQAVYSDTEMRQVPDAKERFAVEIKNWLEFAKTAEDQQ